MNRRLTTWLWGLLAFLSVGIAVVSYRVLSPHPMVGEDVASNLMFRPWLAIHAAFAATALILGPWQFLPRLRARRPKLHRWMGRTYVVCCLAAGVAGLPLAWGTNAGLLAQTGFGALAVCWIVANVQAWRLALAGRFTEHRRWMIRSFALTFAAVTLRLYLPFPPLMGFSFLAGYAVIAWVAWVPNLIVAEAYIRRRPGPKVTTAAA